MTAPLGGDASAAVGSTQAAGSALAASRDPSGRRAVDLTCGPGPHAGLRQLQEGQAAPAGRREGAHRGGLPPGLVQLRPAHDDAAARRQAEPGRRPPRHGPQGRRTSQRDPAPCSSARCCACGALAPGKPDTAADVGAKPGSAVFSPVTGTVVKVKKYKLYGKWDDYELHIQPDGHPGLDVVMIHVTDVCCRPGDRVLAGVTRSRPFARSRTSSTSSSRATPRAAATTSTSRSTMPPTPRTRGSRAQSPRGRVRASRAWDVGY